MRTPAQSIALACLSGLALLPTAQAQTLSIVKETILSQPDSTAKHKLVVKLVPPGASLPAVSAALFESAQAYELAMAPALNALSNALALVPEVKVSRLVASPLPGWVELELDSRLPLSELLNLVQKMPLVEVAQENHTLKIQQTNDPSYASQNSFLGNKYPWNPKVGTAIAKYSTGTARFDAVVVDSGAPLDSNLTDTGANRAGADFITSASSARDGDGRDANPLDQGSSGCANSSSWHGMRVASVLGGIANNSRAAYGAYYNNAGNIIHARALGNCGSGNLSDVVAAMVWAAGGSVAGIPNAPSTVRVVNLSLGSGGRACSAMEQDAVNFVRARGIAPVAAAGNAGTAVIDAPSNCAGVYAIAAIRSDTGARESFTNYSTSVTASTSGSALAVRDTSSGNPGGSYTTGVSSGTSFSAPIFSGVVLRVLSERPNWTGVQAADHVVATTAPITHSSCAGGVCGKGSVDLDRALTGIAALKPAAACPAATLRWNSPFSSAVSCSASTAQGNSGASVDLSAFASGGALLGKASYICSNGAWQIDSTKPAPSCNANCPAGTATWKGSNGETCSAPHESLTSNGQQLTLKDDTKPFGGTGYVSCQSNGSGLFVSGQSTCRDIRVYCPTTEVTWNAIGTTCKDTLSRAVEGTEAVASSSGLLARGTKTFRCDAATAKWVASSAGSCLIF